MFAIWYPRPRFGNLFIQSAAKCTSYNMYEFHFTEIENLFVSFLRQSLNNFSPTRERKSFDSNVKLRKRSGLSLLLNFSQFMFRGFKVFYNRRYFLNFRRYLKNQAGEAGARLRAVRGPGLLCPPEAPEIQHFVDQKMYFRDCQTLRVFERIIPLTFSLEFRFHHA